MQKDKCRNEHDTTKALVEISAPARMIFEAMALAVLAILLIQARQNQPLDIVALDDQPPHLMRFVPSSEGAQWEGARSLFCMNATDSEDGCSYFKSLVALQAQSRGD